MATSLSRLSAVSTWLSSRRNPCFLSSRNRCSMVHRARYQSMICQAASVLATGWLVSSRQVIGSLAPGGSGSVNSIKLNVTCAGSSGVPASRGRAIVTVPNRGSSRGSPSVQHLPFEITVEVRDTCLCLNLQRAARAVARRFDAVLRPLGLTNGQFSLLMSLNREDAPSIDNVSALLAMDPTTLTANLKPLERRGLVRVTLDDADKRTRRLKLTSAGRALLVAAVPIWRDTHAAIETRGGYHCRVQPGSAHGKPAVIGRQNRLWLPASLRLGSGTEETFPQNPEPQVRIRLRPAERRANFDACTGRRAWKSLEPAIIEVVPAINAS